MRRARHNFGWGWLRPGRRVVAWGQVGALVRVGMLAVAVAVAGGLTGCAEGPPPPKSTQAGVLTLLKATDADATRRDELVESGANTFARMSCGTCHAFDATPMTGPRLDRLYERPLQLVDPDRPTQAVQATRDRAYLWRSIATPHEQQVHGYTGAQRMTNFGHLMDDEDVAGLIALLESRTRDGDAESVRDEESD